MTKQQKNKKKSTKIQRSLPIERWGPKVTTIEKAQNLRTLPFYDLVGKPETNELTLNSNIEEPPSLSKYTTINSNMKEISSDFENSENEEDNDEEH